MKEIRDSGKVVGLDRIAAIAALNLANELLKIHNRDKQVEGRLRCAPARHARKRIDGALARGPAART